MCHQVYSISFDCACSIANPTDPTQPIAMNLCDDALTYNNGIVCANSYLKTKLYTEHYARMCNQHALQIFQISMGAVEIYQPEKTSFASIKQWYKHKDSTFSTGFTNWMVERWIGHFVRAYSSKEEKERMWHDEVRRPMFGYEYVESELPHRRGWKKFVGVESGTASNLTHEDALKELAEVPEWVEIWEAEKEADVGSEKGRSGRKRKRRKYNR